MFRRAALERALALPDEQLPPRPTTHGSSSEPAASCGSSPATAENIKITTQTDLRLAELLLSEGAG